MDVEHNKEFHETENGTYKVETFKPIEKEPQKSYYAILPATVRYDNRLKPNAKLLYAEVTALTNEKGYCWASNEYFAKLYGVTIRAVKQWFQQLYEFGYLRYELIRDEKTKQVTDRKIFITEKVNSPGANIFPTPRENNFPTSGKNIPTPRENNFPNNTKLINTKFNIYMSPLEQIEEIYSLYPTKCPINGRRIKKGEACKKKIDKLLKEHGKDTMIKTINGYLKECSKTKTFICDFTTMLNSFADYIDDELPDWVKEQLKLKAEGKL